jgi:AraC-like DNA-binding protein
MEFQHFHPFYEILILLEDSADHLIDGKIYTIQLYDIVLLQPGLLHKSKYLEGNPSKRVIVDFTFPKDLYNLESSYIDLLSLFQAPVPIYRFERVYLEQILGILNEIFKLSKTLTPMNQMMIHHKFIEFLYELHKFKDYNIYENESIMDANTKKIYAITAFIHHNYKEPLSLEMIAKQFYISSYYLSHQFKYVTGFTLTNYIQMTRIKNAQQLLLSTNNKITGIAEGCGFNSFSQFNRVFNKFCNMSPTQFRSQENIKSIQRI